MACQLFSRFPLPLLLQHIPPGRHIPRKSTTVSLSFFVELGTYYNPFRLLTSKQPHKINFLDIKIIQILFKLISTRRNNGKPSKYQCIQKEEQAILKPSKQI